MILQWTPESRSAWGTATTRQVATHQERRERMATISKKRAEALWSELRSALELSEEKIRQIVKTKAWEPLGYDTFAECWADKLSDLKLYGEIRAVIVYQMFDEGASESDVRNSVAGVGAKASKRLKTAHDKGMSIQAAEKFSRVQEHYRKSPTAQRYVRAELTTDQLEHVKAAAGVYDLSVDEFVKRAVLREAAVAESGYVNAA